jgi:transcription elongation factor Elf1
VAVVTVTTPIEIVTVLCPSCGKSFETPHRRSVNLGLGETFTKAEMRRWTVATCPMCGAETKLSTLVVGSDGVWTVRS